MRTFLWVVLGLNQILILLLISLRLKQYEMSDFAFREQVTFYSADVARIRRQLHKQLPEVKIFWLTKIVLALASSFTLFSHLNRPLVGLMYGLIAVLILVVLSRLLFMQKFATRIFESGLPVALKLTTILHPLWAVIGIPIRVDNSLPHSREEYVDQLRKLPSTVLDHQQRLRLETLLSSEQKTVKNIMTVKKRVLMVAPSATLGPIVLSDLQKSGHGYFPVAAKKGEPEGILDLSSIADIHMAKQSQVVRDFMSPYISWISEDASLFDLAQLFLQEKQYLIIARNSEEKFTGVVTIADLMKHLVGIVKD